MKWAYIDRETGTWDGVEHDTDEAADGFDANEIPPNFETGGCVWSPTGRGWRDVAPLPQPLMTVGRFKLLLTQPERIAIRAAADQNASVYDFLDLLNGFTDGVALDDPILVTAISQIQAAGLLSEERAAAVLSGQAP